LPDIPPSASMAAMIRLLARSEPSSSIPA